MSGGTLLITSWDRELTTYPRSLVFCGTNWGEKQSPPWLGGSLTLQRCETLRIKCLHIRGAPGTTLSAFDTHLAISPTVNKTSAEFKATFWIFSGKKDEPGSQYKVGKLRHRGWLLAKTRQGGKGQVQDSNPGRTLMSCNAHLMVRTHTHEYPSESQWIFIDLTLVILLTCILPSS